MLVLQGVELQEGQRVIESQATGGCEGQGFTLNEEGQCVSRPGRMPTLPG
jgi:hypothetical protein